MSEALRDLVVSLSLQTDNFTRNIRSVNKQIQEAESKFRLAAAGVENFEATATGLSSKLSTLQQRLLLQENAVGQYERALTAANAKLQECYTRQNDYAARLQTAREAQSALKQQVAAAAEQVRHYSATLGENDSVTIAARGNLDLLKEGYRLSCQEVKKLSGQNTALQKTTQNAADAVSQANTNLNNARAGVKATQAEIDRCSKALALAQTNWDDANTTIKASTATITTFGKEINLAESRFRLAAAGIKDIEKSVPGLSAKLTMLNEKMGLQERQVDQYAIALDAARAKLIAAQQANDPQAIQAATNEVIDAEAALNDARAALESTRAEIQRTNQQLNTARSAWTRLGESLDTFGDKMQKSGQLLTSAGRALTTTITTPIAALGAVAIKSSISFESAFASVRKTVDATEDEFASLSAEVKQMSTEVATSADDIAEVMAVAGQLGIATEHLSEFTRTMVDLGNSTDIVAAEAASTLAKFANITSMDQSQFGNLGATLVDLGNNYATTESAIMEMSLRLAAAGHQVGLSEAQILGFATALSAVGIEAQMGGSAFSKALVKMEVAAATGGQALTDFATICGMSEEQFIQMWNADPAAVFQAFIEGLASMDDEGMSAIAVLNEIGISEVRLRDTLLRSVNATELFANTQATATAAWNENVALTEEAGKRYATTASQLTNLKNKAILFGQQIGDDLNPVIKDLISGANDMLDSFLEMDEAQRMQIIQFAGFAAAIGPVLLLVGKLHTGIGKAATGIGKFATAVGKAGGGAKGFFSVLSKSPSFWLAIAAAAITASVAIIDYASGAKMAREAMEGMNKTADEWKNNAAETFYGNSEGLSFFGMSADDFARDAGNMQTWLDGLLRVWSDGEKETNEIVTHWTDSFKSMTAATRSELEALKETADAGGYTTVSESLAADIATLDAIDAEVEKLLKKRQNGHFTEKDQKRLQELIDMRGAIEIKYNLTAADPDGFDTIRRKVDAEVARAQARGQSDASVTVYQNAMVASAEGMAAVNAKLDEQYDKEYQVIMLMEDGAEKQAALDDLNTRYLADRRAAALEYAETLAGIVMPVWNQEDIQQTNNDVARLIQLMREYSAADEADKPAILEEMNQLTAGMDEGALVEYVGILMQIQSLLDSGMTEDDLKLLFPEIDFTTALDQIAAIQAFLNNRPGVLPGLEVMFGEALPEEVLKIATDLDMTGAQARWDAFAANPGAITTAAVIQSYTEAETAIKQQPLVNAVIAKYTEIPEGADKSQLTPAGLVAYVSVYAEATSGVDVSGLTPQNIVGIVSGYQELASGTDVSQLSPSDITAYVLKYMEDNNIDTTGLTPDAITATVMAYEEVTGGALTTALTPDNICALICKYLEAEGVDISALSPDQIEATVSAFAEATGCDKSTLMQNFVAYIAKYDDTNAQKPVLTLDIGLSGYDLMAYRNFIKNNPVEVEGIVRLGETYEDPTEALLDPNAKFWHEGTEIPVTAVTEDMLTADKVAVLADDGTLHVLVTPKITGSEQARADLSSSLDTDYVSVQFGFGDVSKNDWGFLNSILGGSTMDWVKGLSQRMDFLLNNWNSWVFFGGLTSGLEKDGIEDQINQQLGGDALAQLTAYTSEAVKAINEGYDLSDLDVGNLEAILEFVRMAEELGIGQNVRGSLAQSLTDAGVPTTTENLLENLQLLIDDAKGVGEDAGAGIGEGMASADLTPYAQTVAANADTALRSSGAFDSASPANSTKPVGADAALGIGEGMAATDLSSYAATTAAGVRSSLSAQLNALSMKRIGTNAMAGLVLGILSGRAAVVAAMKLAARSAVNAAKTELKIASPSRVFRDEVGAMTMEGFGEGVLDSTKEQAKIIRNASRYLTGEAKTGSISTGSTDNRRTYNNNVSSTVQVAQMTVRDEQDIRSLAIEIASLSRRQQRGRGLRMA